MIKKYRPLLGVFIAAFLGFCIHTSVAYFFFRNEAANFYYPLSFLYAMFCLLSTVIVIILININARQIGYAFLFLTCLKMAIAYVVLQPILHATDHGGEKLHFFAVFAIFLTLETTVAVRILNKN